ncbi:MAG TPA: hypothetical protein VIM14_11790 [Polyangia bacterium]
MKGGVVADVVVALAVANPAASGAIERTTPKKRGALSQCGAPTSVSAADIVGVPVRRIAAVAWGDRSGYGWPRPRPRPSAAIAGSV